MIFYEQKTDDWHEGKDNILGKKRPFTGRNSRQ
jgi:hypothetical protein